MKTAKREKWERKNNGYDPKTHKTIVTILRKKESSERHKSHNQKAING